MKIVITPKGIKETFGEKNFMRLGKALRVAKLSTVKELPKLIKNGRMLTDNELNQYNANSVIKYVYIQANANVDGKPVKVNIDIRKSPEKNSFWVHKIDFDIKNNGVPDQAYVLDKGFTYSVDNTIPQSDLIVKDNVSHSFDKTDPDIHHSRRREGQIMNDYRRMRAGEISSEEFEKRYDALVEQHGAISKSENSALMHSLYAVANSGNGQEILKLLVEELNDVNSDGTIFRSYQLQDVIKIPTASVRVQNNPSSLTNTVGNIDSVSDLFQFVKQNDKEFNPKPVSKVVNEDGTPMAVYHGTSKGGHTVFDPWGKGKFGLFGIWGVTSAKFAILEHTRNKSIGRID